MFENYQICPYTGLRSFTEDESLYFKGREVDIDQAMDQLQRNKFLMLTGASGDGKSSLVYAGIIPNARAGFLKSRYSQWCIADFRPERSPFQNLCKALARQLDIDNPYTVQGELNHGFSALVDLYKNSKRYVDTHSASWLQATDKEKAAMKRDASNLIIIVDQFEEFFTNPENYQQGAPSKDANIVINLLLETARIALEEDLPVYVIFTMRSDYIGQCAAFRGLPEYIGFSQFFVPRLNRTQLQQVIEEATLSGNSITRRLTERLIHDITEGVDQLPILQHALNQIWVAADKGAEEMDLIHYAMVGGMAASELPEVQVGRFEQWFGELSPEIKACYHAPGLQNVLDTHTNKLYEQSPGYYQSKTGKEITSQDAKRVIRTAFTCLTKIDQSRAVRNRMTLQEISSIVGDPAFDAPALASLLNIFREPGNTFLHPFISEEDPQSLDLQPSQVLDITHESLIRNWQYLGRWAKEEFESYSVSLDFEKQLDRWVDSNKSNSFLLSIGPLTYFETWFKNAKPNVWWIARYLPEESSKEAKLEKAKRIRDNSLEFLSRSAKKHIVTRTVMRFGAKRIAAVIGIIALLTLTSFAVSKYYQRQKGYILNSIGQKVDDLAGNQNIILVRRAAMIAEELKLGRSTVDGSIGAIKDPVQKIKVANALASLLIFQGRTEPRQQIERSLLIADSLLESAVVSDTSRTQTTSALLHETNLLRATLELGYFYRPDSLKSNLRKRNALRSARWTMLLADRQPADFSDVQNFTLALENAVNYKQYSAAQIRKLLEILSPFEEGKKSDWVKRNFHKDRLLLRGDIGENYGFKFNGLYQELAYLYAAEGNAQKSLQCVDTLLAYSQNNFQGDYTAGMDNASNIAKVYIDYDHPQEQNVFVNGYCIRKKITEEEFYIRMLGRTLRSFGASFNIQLYPFMNELQNLNLQFCTSKQLQAIYDKYREVVEATITNPAQKNYLLAISYKNQGIEESLIHETATEGESSVDDLFKKAFSYYSAVETSYLDQSIVVIGTGGTDERVSTRKSLFLFPDLKTSFHPLEPRSFFYPYYGDCFLNYIIRNKLFGSLYHDNSSLQYISDWFSDWNAKNIGLPGFMAVKPRISFYKLLRDELNARKDSSSADFNLLCLYYGKEAQDSGKTNEMLLEYDKIEKANIFNLLRTKEFAGQIRNQTLRLIGYAMMGYARTGHMDRALKLAAMFKNPVNRSSLYAFTAVELMRNNVNGPFVGQLIDSAKIEMSRQEGIKTEQPNRRILAHALSMQSASENLGKSYELIKNLPEKFASIEGICSSLSFHGDLYGATQNIPEYISASDEAYFIRAILQAYSEGNGNGGAGWIEFENSYQTMQNHFIQYIDESN